MGRMEHLVRIFRESGLSAPGEIMAAGPKASETRRQSLLHMRKGLRPRERTRPMEKTPASPTAA